jgi:hypothetical protein
MAWRLFYSYSHLDADERNRLSTYLAPLVKSEKIVEWYDRKIEPGKNWESEISNRLEAANLVLFLVSENFLASDYCFGVEVDRALARLKRGEVKVVPILVKPCLWQASRLSELQFIPHDGVAIKESPSPEKAFADVAKEILKLVSAAPPEPSVEDGVSKDFDSSLDLVSGQVRSYAHLYERIRQRMHASNERTQRMEEVFQKMRALANASYPLLDELTNSPSPGERLAAVAILQAFASQRYIDFLVKLVGSEKPFVGYHAAKALHFAVGALDPRVYPQLLAAIIDSQAALDSAQVGFDTDRRKLLRDAERELRSTIASLSPPGSQNR